MLRGLLVAICLTAFVLRVFHLRSIASVALDIPPPDGMDRWLSMHIASAIADGDWLGGWSAPYDSSPGYSYLLAALYWLSGRRWIGPLLVQAALGALTPLLLYALARPLFGAAVGVTTAALGALYIPAVFYEGLLVKYSLLPFIVTAALLCTERAHVTGRASSAALAGLTLGAFVLLRPNALVVAPVLAAWAAWPHERRVGLRTVAWVAAGTAFFLAPMVARNVLATRVGLASSLSGIHFYIGTNAAADGEYVVVPGIRPDIVGHVIDARHAAEKRLGHHLSPAQVSRYWFERGVAFIRQNPGRYALLTVRKVWLAFEAGESGSFGDDFEDMRGASRVLNLPFVVFGTIAPLGLIGAFSARRERGARLLLLFIAALVMSLLPFFVAGRYRLPIVPPMIVLAAVGLGRVEEAVHRRGIRALFPVLPLLIALAIVLGASDAQVFGLLLVTVLGVLMLARAR